MVLLPSRSTKPILFPISYLPQRRSDFTRHFPPAKILENNSQPAFRGAGRRLRKPRRFPSGKQRGYDFHHHSARSRTSTTVSTTSPEESAGRLGKPQRDSSETIAGTVPGTFPAGRDRGKYFPPLCPGCRHIFYVNQGIRFVRNRLKTVSRIFFVERTAGKSSLGLLSPGAKSWINFPSSQSDEAARFHFKSFNKRKNGDEIITGETLLPPKRKKFEIGQNFTAKLCANDRSGSFLGRRSSRHIDHFAEQPGWSPQSNHSLRQCCPKIPDGNPAHLWARKV